MTYSQMKCRFGLLVLNEDDELNAQGMKNL